GRIKGWILGEFEGLVGNGRIEMDFGGDVKEISEDRLRYRVDGERNRIENDFVFVMSGYHGDDRFLRKMGVGIDEARGRPIYG
ncbi:NAD(P)-binding domain-containing protein, partial [Bacillus thuringiensis]|uniref:NAD(P)-binding domain-containing protein n=1 Tax=Bacillus thuringiensis TaxID=1428 RepID=UPI0016426FC8